MEEARRLGGGRRVLLGGSLTIARALSVSNIFLIEYTSFEGLTLAIF